MGFDVFDLNYLRKRTVSIHCGRCRVRFPTAEKILVALVTRSRMINVIDDPLKELLAEFDWNERDLCDPFEESQMLTPNKFVHRIMPVKDSEARVFRVIRDPKPVKEDNIREQIQDRRPHLSPEELEAELNEEIGPVYSTRSEEKGRLGIVEVVDDQSGHCNVECYSCGSLFMIDRVEASLVATHVTRFSGVCFVDARGFTVDGSKKPFGQGGGAHTSVRGARRDSS